MRKNLNLLCVFILLIIFFACTPSKAMEGDGFLSLSCGNQNVLVGKDFSVVLSANSEEPCNISAFRIKLKFDKSKLTFKSASPKDSINANEIKYSLNGDTVTAIYLTSNEGINLIPGVEIPLCSFKFNPKEIYDASSSTISASIDGMTDYDINEIITGDITPLTVNIVDKLPFDCTLKFLASSDGDIYPEFDPNIYDYDLNVPYSTKSVEFDAVPNNENATAKINRKNLNSAGSTTPIYITVTDNETNDKAVYTVNVKREAKPVSNDSNSSSTGSKKSSRSKGSTSSSGYSYSDSYDFDSDFDDSTLSENPSDETIDAIAPAEKDSDQINSSNTVSKTIVVKENKFNIFFAGVCLATLLFIIGYLIKNRLNNEHTGKKIINT